MKSLKFFPTLKSETWRVIDCDILTSCCRQTLALEELSDSNMGNLHIYLIINVTITLGGNSEDIVNLQNYLIAHISFQTI